MNILAVDTSCGICTAAIMQKGIITASSAVSGKHSDRLLPQIKYLMETCELTPADIDYYAAAAGPGSFTGIRIGISMLKGMAQATDKPCIPVSSLAGLAANVMTSNYVIVPIIDARREQVYNGLYNNEIKSLREDKCCLIDELLEECNKLDKSVIFIGNGVPIHKDKIRLQCANAILAPAHLNTNMASSIAYIASQSLAEAVSYNDFVPNYLKLSQAERELRERA